MQPIVSRPQLPGAWRYILMRVWHDFLRHRTVDTAASLTFFSTLALFPGALTLVSGVALFQDGDDAVDDILTVARYVIRPDAAEAIRAPLEQLLSLSSPGAGFAVGLIGTLWSLSGYTTAFGRAMNTVYEVEEGRRIWKFRGQMMLVTLVLMVSYGAIAVILLVTPTVIDGIGDAAGFGRPWIDLWNVLKWPVLVGLAVFVVGLLYYFTPNIRPPRIRWVSYGALLALGVWALCTTGFAIYVATVSNYDRVYGWLGGAIITLIYSYISNFVLVIGGELDSEILRMRQLNRGIPAEESIPLPLRDTTRNLVLARNREWDIRNGRAIREAAVREHGAELREQAGDRPVLAEPAGDGSLR
ncbi:YhjD/YihY/BrkB family envelope integrity protein [Frigoribacterium sp. 2-23]|uniref:YhjD/YihY/BrkB family envelope integrity protein n=1 Tax=Frigoribacterium sp. 2-23 TaxID=3415006 RepID=UPI003C6EB4B1